MQNLKKVHTRECLADGNSSKCPVCFPINAKHQYCQVYGYCVCTKKGMNQEKRNTLQEQAIEKIVFSPHFIAKEMSYEEYTAMVLLKQAIRWICGDDVEKPITNNCDAIELIAQSLSRMGLGIDNYRRVGK